MKLYVGVQTELDRRVVVTSSIGQFADYSLSVELNDLQDFKWGSAVQGVQRVWRSRSFPIIWQGECGTPAFAAVSRKR
jgi:hypothetical protein